MAANATDEEMLAMEMNAAPQKSNPTEEETANPTTESNDNESKRELELLDETFYEQYDADSVARAVNKYIKSRRNYPKPFIEHDLLECKDPKYWHSKAVPKESDEEYDGWFLGMSRKRIKDYGITKNFRPRLRRAAFVISTPLICLIIATFIEAPLNKIIGAGLLAMFTIYIGQVLFYVLSTRNSQELYRVYSVSDKPKNWANINTAYLQLIYDKESIQSISELSAINGGITKTMLNTLGAYTWAAVSIHFAGQLYYNRCVFDWDVADIFEIVGTSGIVLISIFELDPFSNAMGTAHYTGVIFAALCPAGYCIQQWHIDKFAFHQNANGVHHYEEFVFSVVLYVVAITALLLFMICGWATDEDQFEAKKKWNKDLKRNKYLEGLVPPCFKKKGVNTYSKMNIVFEAIAIYLVTVSLCLWLIEYDTDCEIGCAGIGEDGEHCNISMHCNGGNACCRVI